jgi:hypothetical protein
LKSGFLSAEAFSTTSAVGSRILRGGLLGRKELIGDRKTFWRAIVTASESKSGYRNIDWLGMDWSTMEENKRCNRNNIFAH